MFRIVTRTLRLTWRVHSYAWPHHWMVMSQPVWNVLQVAYLSMVSETLLIACHRVANYALSLPHSQLYRPVPHAVVAREGRVKFACVWVCNCVLSEKYGWIYLCFELLCSHEQVFNVECRWVNAGRVLCAVDWSAVSVMCIALYIRGVVSVYITYHIVVFS